MGFEIPINNNYPKHPKTAHIKRLLGPEADCYPMRLWCWASEYATDGTIRIPIGNLEAALEWSGKHGRLHRALIRAGFIEEDGVTIHDWVDGIGHALMIYDAKKASNRRNYLDTIMENTSDGVMTDDVKKIMRAIAQAAVPGRIKTKRQYAEAWAKRVGADESVNILLSEEAQGQNLLWLDDNLFGGKKAPQKKRQSPTARARGLKK